LTPAAPAACRKWRSIAFSHPLDQLGQPSSLAELFATACQVMLLQLRPIQLLAGNCRFHALL
jgi:hypothetical protein